MSSCLKLVIRPNIVAHCQQKPIVFNIPRLVHTSPVVELRKAPVGRGSPLVRMINIKSKVNTS